MKLLRPVVSTDKIQSLFPKRPVRGLTSSSYKLGKRTGEGIRMKKKKKSRKKTSSEGL